MAVSDIPLASVTGSCTILTLNPRAAGSEPSRPDGSLKSSRVEYHGAARRGKSIGKSASFSCEPAERRQSEQSADPGDRPDQ